MVKNSPPLSQKTGEGKTKKMKNVIKNFVIIFVLLIGFTLFVLSNQTLGWRAFIVTSASMEPAVGTGSLVVTQYKHPNTLSKNDIITFIPPIKTHAFITHRISKVSQNKSLTTFKTKGDNNKNEDKWTLAGGGVVGKVTYIIPYLGFFMSFVQSKIGILLFILLPAVYIIIDEIFNIAKTIKHHKKKIIPANEISTTALLIFLSSIFFPLQPAYALLSDSAGLTNNTFTVNSITPTVTPFEFPSCKDPHGTIISSYKTGRHEIIGVGLLIGSDTVYQLTEGSKEKVLQCFCPESGPGIQTNWIKTTEIERFKFDGWPHSITSGLSWNLDDNPYVAQNIEYTCN